MASLDQLCVNTIRTLSMDAVQKANSGHPGMPMGMADVSYILWTKFLKHNPKNPEWFDRDRFILSAGHGSMLIYSLLHLTGYDLSLDEIKNFRQMGSKTAGHPEKHLTPGVEMTTGPLGQGFATGVGMAMAEKFMAGKFNTSQHKIVDHYTYAIVSDGDLMEGISHEAASLAGHLQLGKMIYLYDANSISIDGSTDLSFTEDPVKRFEAYGWHVQEIDGHDHAQIEDAINKAQSEASKPSIVICRTHIGFGSPNKQDSASSHGSPLGEDEIVLTKKGYGWDPEKKFFIPEEALAVFREEVVKGEASESTWNDLLTNYQSEQNALAQEFKSWINRELPENLESLLPVFEADEKGVASRSASGTVLNALKDVVANLFGGSADLEGSVKTNLKDEGVFNTSNSTGRNVHYGVREHGMAAALNGMALHGGIIPFGGTFFVFTDYCRPSIRLAGLMKTPSIFVMTHDSIGLGEDGPTHQPVEHLASLRAMPNVNVIRPGDANEVSYAWKSAIESQETPTIIVLTRQNIPTFSRDGENAAKLTQKGAYILADSKKETPDAIIVGTGSEVHLAMEAKSTLETQGIDVRVVSMPCWELFQEQSDDYKEKVLPKAVTNRVSVEAGSTFGWQKWIGDKGTSIGIDTFGESAPFEELYDHFGITTEKVVDAVISQM
ncbi:MAG TPA: transketolase [Balneola sp.]|jgi:transketolase|nr:transketolase [Bacteroidota bacterium]MAC06806.1 transketolase [Balneola sp.]MAO77002.1 transketolase [Balneola sp.]MBF64569.1 transketolase [Balneola sp.]MBF65686.1 transketolase [Balneola sp.]|tara:strand:- start:594 stop:2588 length:1995 start_codon:yes stop_codon:yes gene_type:complete